MFQDVQSHLFTIDKKEYYLVVVTFCTLFITVILIARAVPSQPPKNVQATPLSSRSIRVAWSPPPLYTLHGILQGYKVLYKPVREDEGMYNLYLHVDLRRVKVLMWMWI
jgi:hypothetical protein